MATRAVVGYYLHHKYETSAKSHWKGVYVHFGEPSTLGEALYKRLIMSDEDVKKLIDIHKCGFSIFPTKPYYEDNCNYFTNKSINVTVKQKHGGHIYQFSEITFIDWLYLFNMYEKRLNVFNIKIVEHTTTKKDIYEPKIKLVKSISYLKDYNINWEKIDVKRY